MSNHSFIRVAVAAITITAAFAPTSAVQAQVTNINFDDLTFSNFAVLQAGYQSRATNTPNVVVGFRTLTTRTNNVVTDNVELWNTGYSTLSKNAFQSQNGADFEMRLTADAGHTATLQSFDFGAFDSVNTSSFLTITDSNLGVLYTEGSNTVVKPNVRHFTTPFTSSNGGTLTLRYGTDFNLGIDNIVISQDTSAAPESSALVLSAVGLALMGGIIVRRRAR